MKLKILFPILSLLVLMGCSANLLNQRITYSKPLYQKPTTEKVAAITRFHIFSDGEPASFNNQKALEKSISDAIYSTGMYKKVYSGNDVFNLKERDIDRYQVDVYARDYGKYNWLLAWPAIYPMPAYWPIQPYSGVVEVEFRVTYEGQNETTNQVISNNANHSVFIYGFFRKYDVENKAIPLYYTGLDQLRDFVLKVNMENGNNDIQYRPVKKSVEFDGDVKNIAILNLRANGITKHEVDAMTNRLNIELFNTGRFSILERGQMEEILEEQGFQQSGCTSSECAVEAGRLLNVQQMITGSISKVGEIYSVEVRLIDVETGKIEAVGVEDIRGGIEDVLTSGMNKVVWNLLGAD